MRADEGMWLLSLINKNYNEMKAKGLKLTPDDIYNINKACLKDAIVGLSNSKYAGGFFCTAEIISGEGLFLTNHHCGYESIQQHSSVEHDYLKDGFWAMNKSQELMNEDMTASILVRMEDVTDRVLKAVNDTMSETARSSAINKVMKVIEKEAMKDNHYDAWVKNMFDGNQFFLFIYETYKDVRLVGAPPSSIGKFGGDTDNWMWPRHTGDFSMFRIYTAPDGKPAKYAAENIPLKPKHHLPISLKGVQKDDFSMVLGFPGRTQRYMTSYGIEETVDVSNPIRIRVRTKKLELMKQDMNASDKVRIQYAAKYAQSANYWKYSIGQNKGLKRLNVYEQKKALEDSLTKWIEVDQTRKTTYGEALYMIEKAYDAKKVINAANNYVSEALLQGAEVNFFPYQASGLFNLLKTSPTNTDAIKAAAADLKAGAAEYFKDYNAATDKKILAAMLEMYYKDVAKEFHLDVFETINKKFKGDFNKYAEDLFAKSIFVDQAKYEAFLANPTLKVLEKDPAYILMSSSLAKYMAIQQMGGSNENMKKGTRLFVDGLMKMQPNKLFYPNANSCIRITYGSVGDYKPADAVHYNYWTTLQGYIEKEDSTSDEFVVPAKLKDLYYKADYGQYADKDGTMHVCFTTNNDITGGNSGSPVINGNGELIGTAFDGNWEAMSGDIKFETQLQKCINADIRYILFVVDKYAGATNLINEMTLVK